MNWGLKSIPLSCLAVTLLGLPVTTACIPATIHCGDAHALSLLSQLRVTAVWKGPWQSDNSGKMNSPSDTNLANYNQARFNFNFKWKMLCFENIWTLLTGYLTDIVLLHQHDASSQIIVKASGLLPMWQKHSAIFYCCAWGNETK